MPKYKIKPLSEIPSILIADFWTHFIVGSPDECWIWEITNSKGYGRLRCNGLLPEWRAHRVAYYIYNGVDPAELFVCHSCDNPPCVNPAHLFLGTDLDNMADKMSKGRHKWNTTNHPLGNDHGRSKVNEDDVRKIRKLFASGHRQSSIARIFGIRHSNVQWIISRKTWKHVL